jgi:hypothetical protein
MLNQCTYLISLPSQNLGSSLHMEFQHINVF